MEARLAATLVASLLLVATPACSWAAHGLALDGELKYPAGFASFDYVSAKAVKGGDLVLHAIGSYDKMNPFTLKGSAPQGLETLVFEPLTVASLDEPFAQYGLLAKEIIVADDKMSVTFVLHEAARFSDGSRVTAEDVAFSVETFKGDDVHPFYPYYYADISRAEVVAEDTVTIHFTTVNRELPLIAGQMPVLSKTFFDANAFAGRDLIAPLGSGPYVVESFARGKSIKYRRNPDYWAAGHPVRNHMFNFDSITYRYYKDQTVAVEAFKAGEFDLLPVNVAKQWARDLDGPKIERGEIIKRKFPHRNNAGMQGFVMNTRREIFKDRAVRRAIGLAFDFEWTNKTIFFNQYERSHSYFSNSYLAASGLPDDAELRLLEPLRPLVPEAVFNEELSAPRTDRPGGIRENLRQAVELLRESGWQIENGVMRDRDGNPLSFEIILASPTFERVMAPFTNNLKKIGIEASYRTIDSALYTEKINNFDFDMCVYVYGQSQSPGNEQRNFWHSDAADRKGSRNLAGIRDEAVDRLIDQVIYATNRRELTAAVKALDRVLWYGYYLVPNWYLDGHRIAYHNRFEFPETLPTYYSYEQLLMTWWLREETGVHN